MGTHMSKHYKLFRHHDLWKYDSVETATSQTKLCENSAYIMLYTIYQVYCEAKR